MTRTGWLAALLLTASPWTCFGQFGGMGGRGGLGGGMIARHNVQVEEDWTVKVDTFGGQSVTGKLRLASVMVQCDLGTYEIKPEKVKSIDLAAPEANVPPSFGQFGVQRAGSVTTASGEKVPGVVAVPNSWRIETELGTLYPDPQQLKTLTFLARVPAPSADKSAPLKPAAAKPADDKKAPSKPADEAKPADDKSAGEKKPG